MKEFCVIIKPYVCKKCGNDTLYFLTHSNMLIGYKDVFSNGRTLSELKEVLEQKDVKYIKCISCNKIFIIDWSHGFPKQLIDRNELHKFGV